MARIGDLPINQGGFPDRGFETELVTSGNEWTTLYEFVPEPDVVTLVRGIVIGRRSDRTGGAYRRNASFRREGSGSVFQIGETEIYQHEDLPNMDVEIDTNGTTIRVQVRGLIDQSVTWKAWLRVWEL